MSAWTRMWLSAFVVTQAVETPLYALALTRDGPPRALGRRVAYGFLASLFTHPVVWFVIPEIVPLDRYELFFVCAEGFAVCVEWLWMRALGVRRALVWALLANTASVLVGHGLRAAVGWP